MPTSESDWPERRGPLRLSPVPPPTLPGQCLTPVLHPKRSPRPMSDVTVVDVTEEDVTLGELSRRLDRMEEGELARFKALDDRMTYTVVTRDYYEGRHQVLSERIAQLQAEAERRATRWAQAWIAIAAALVASLGSLIIVLVQAHK